MAIVEVAGVEEPENDEQGEYVGIYSDSDEEESAD